eukprot:TRINITY_DN2709_c0_g1_i2.p1 TRINITY_DN2709_c0_g1~~TRINITY_DN2709_c0_g1_i2.p1  ORF type:complete len:400 (+),score=37.73 TRINITY_DN2709_c0_g1_i2:95-1294(+)
MVASSLVPPRGLDSLVQAIEMAPASRAPQNPPTHNNEALPSNQPPQHVHTYPSHVQHGVEHQNLARVAPMTAHPPAPTAPSSRHVASGSPPGPLPHPVAYAHPPAPVHGYQMQQHVPQQQQQVYPVPQYAVQPHVGGNTPPQGWNMLGNQPLNAAQVDQIKGVVRAYTSLPKRSAQLRKDFQCKDCPKSFVAKRSLQRHINTAHIRKPDLSCDRCGKVFGSKSSLTTHINTVHLRRKDFSCHVCLKAFGEKGALTKHIKIVHLHLKDHICEHCGKGFGEKGSLTKHVNIVHLLRKDFACDICAKTFGRKSDLNKHVNVVHFQRKGTSQSQKAGSQIVGNSCDVAFVHQNASASASTGSNQHVPSGSTSQLPSPVTSQSQAQSVPSAPPAMSIGALVDHI